MNLNEISPIKMSAQQKQDIIKSILIEESFLNIKLKATDNEVFLAEEPQTALNKLINFDKLNDKERIAYCEHLAELMEMIGNGAYQNLSVFLHHLSQDSYTVQISAIKQLPQIVEQIKKRQSGYDELKEHILPFMKSYLHHPDSQLKREVGLQLLNIAPFLVEQDKVDIVLTHLVDLAHDESNNQNRMIAASILGRTASLFSIKICESFVCGELLALGMDLNEQVREKAIEQLPNLAVALSQKCIEQKLIPFYIEKCQEKLQQIKCACVKALAGICKYVTHKTKVTCLISLYMEFLTNQNKEIRKNAYEYLGAFISSIKFTQAEEQQLEILLAYYQNQIDKNLNILGADLVYKCAFYFPGVLQAIGKERWNLLNPLYKVLLKSQIENVKITLANSFHEVAKILGSDLSKQYLINALEDLCQDKNQEVRNGIIKNLSKFISIFPIDERDYVVDLLLTFQKDQHKWRIRKMICSNIFPITRCFNQETIFFQIAPILFKFCSDTVAMVRRKAAKNVHFLIDTFQEESEQRTTILEQIKAFSHSKRYIQRQSYCWMCYKLFYNIQFEELFYQRFLELCTDPVMSVRISALIVIDKYICKEGFSNQNKYIKYLLIEFIDDSCKEIQNILSKYEFVVQKARKTTPSQRSRNSSTSDQFEDIELQQQKNEQTFTEQV